MDISYFRGTKLNNQNELVENFMGRCCQRINIKDKRRKAEWDSGSADLVLRIDHRGSSKFYLFYKNDISKELKLSF